MTVISHVEGKTETVYRLFDEMAEKHDELVVAYSGGKDSTLLLLLLYTLMVTMLWAFKAFSSCLISSIISPRKAVQQASTRF